MKNSNRFNSNHDIIHWFFFYSVLFDKNMVEAHVTSCIIMSVFITKITFLFWLQDEMTLLIILISSQANYNVQGFNNWISNDKLTILVMGTLIHTMSDEVVSSSSIVQYLRGCNQMLFTGAYTAHQLIYSYNFHSILILSTCSLYMAFFFYLKEENRNTNDSYYCNNQ